MRTILFCLLAFSAALLLPCNVQAQPTKVVVAPSGASLRQAAAATAPKIRVLPYGTPVEVVDPWGPEMTFEGIRANWTKVKALGHEGWLFGGLIGGSVAEHKLLARLGQKASRDHHGLVLCPDTGPPITLVDNLVIGEESVTNLLSDLLPQGFFLISRIGWEWGEHELIRVADGRRIKLDGPPHFSPDDRFFATTALDLEAGFGPNRLQIYEMRDGWPVLVWTHEPTTWGPTEPKWAGSDLSFTKFRTHDPATAGLVRFQADTGAWHLQD